MNNVANYDVAMRYLGVFFNKILYVDLNEDNFSIIKADNTEVDKLPMFISFSQWVKEFITSPYFKPYGENRMPSEFTKYYDLDYLKSLTDPLVLEYQKLINGEYHNIELLLLPIGNGRTFVYVRDNTKMNKTPLQK